SYQSNVYSNEIERSQHDLQSASTVHPSYNAHNRQSYYSQVYPGSSPPHSNHPMSQQQKQSPLPPPPLPLPIPPQQMISQQNISAPSSDLLSNRNGSSADLSVVHPQPNTDRRFIQRDPINSHHNVHEQQQSSPQSQPYKLNVQPPPLSDLLNPPRSISRPVTPPPSQAPQPLISRDNRETFPYLAPPHHQSGSNSSVSTRSSSPAPGTPVANSNSNNNVSYSPHHSPNNNMAPVQIEKPIAEQNASQPKRRGRSQKPRPI
ncbi:341_t:CDS:1, partial [Acaulospora morrowiae]